MPPSGAIPKSAVHGDAANAYVFSVQDGKPGAARREVWGVRGEATWRLSRR